LIIQKIGEKISLRKNNNLGLIKQERSQHYSPKN
jgi:hypothetical protein